MFKGIRNKYKLTKTNVKFSLNVTLMIANAAVCDIALPSAMTLRITKLYAKKVDCSGISATKLNVEINKSEINS